METFDLLLNSSPELHELLMDGDLTLYQTHSLGYTGIAGLPPLSAVRHVIQQRHKTFHDCKPGDLRAIVQIMDLDGAMIPDDRVLYGGDDLDYRTDCIITPNVKGILKRNHDKTAVMRALGNSIAKPIRFGGCEVSLSAFLLLPESGAHAVE
ncbi:hypothetical protein [Bifidobacterium sp. SO1]|uniref:hypothetical protein n=1 Tax=Bifidobacterium sp. SO1 TaxID=2809029 RepID=UPI001BDD7121|nr:hypothetical protein [Bifidobacterium sp. SO1]MBT1162969.1 hypothetical protein [Bifidobacterium sp. SO1]